MSKADSRSTPPPLPREQYRHGNLKSALIAAGIELARAGGPDAVVLREATRRAGVVPNAAYRHFASRDELLEGVRSAALAALAAAMEREIASALAAPAEGDAVADDERSVVLGQARLRAVGAGYLRFAREETGLFRTAFTASTAVDEASSDPARAGPGGLTPFQLLSTALDDLVRAGALSEDRRQGAEFLAWSTVHGMAMLTIDGPMKRLPASEADVLGRRLLEMVVRGL